MINTKDMFNFKSLFRKPQTVTPAKTKPSPKKERVIKIEGKRYLEYTRKGLRAYRPL